MTSEQICGHRWYGPRPEVADAYANHVCQEPVGHFHRHECVCGARDD